MFLARLVSLLMLMITPSALICSQHQNKCLNGKLTCDWLRKLHFSFQKPLKNQPLMKKIWRSASTLASLKVFGRNLSGLGCHLVKRHARVKVESDEVGFRKIGIHRLLKTLINRSVVSKELWKRKFF